jgi:dienelactone hydrolase
MGVRMLRRILPIAAGGAMLAAMVAVLPATATPAHVTTTRAGTLRLTVSPRSSAFDAPLTISISGVTPGQRATLGVTSVDATGVKWSSSSTYVAGPSGTVDPATSPAVPALGVSYFGLDRMGPVDFMTTAAGPGSTFSWWAPKKTTNAFKLLNFVFSASSGQAHASVTVQRGIALPVTASSESVAANGFLGEFWEPPAGENTHVAILEFGGWTGGINPIGGQFASHGYPTLDIAFFGAPGLPKVPKDIPLGYFAKALGWLARQPGVDPKRIWVMGTGEYSGGSAAALLLGAYYPTLVHGVVALVPSAAAGCFHTLSGGGCYGPPWTFDGRPVPYTTQYDTFHPTDNPAALIPVRKIRGPVFLDCGGSDSIWDACSHGETIMAELAAAHDAYPHELLSYPDAGDGIGVPVPYCPGWATYPNDLAGSDVVSNPVALAEQWPKLLAFLHN